MGDTAAARRAIAIGGLTIEGGGGETVWKHTTAQPPIRGGPRAVLFEITTTGAATVDGLVVYYSVDGVQRVYQALGEPVLVRPGFHIEVVGVEDGR